MLTSLVYEKIENIPTEVIKALSILWEMLNRYKLGLSKFKHFKYEVQTALFKDPVRTAQ